MTRLYGLPGSHLTMAVQAMLERKGIDYRRIDLVPFLARAIVRRGMGMRQNTVPVLVVDGRRIRARARSRASWTGCAPTRRCSPPIPSAAALPRRPSAGGRGAAAPDPADLALGDARRPRPRPQLHGALGHGRPAALAARLAPPFIARGVRVNEATDEAVRANLAALDSMLHRVEEWIAAGVLDGEELSAADFQIGASVRLLLTFQDLRPLIEDRGRVAAVGGDRAPGKAAGRRRSAASARHRQRR